MTEYIEFEDWLKYQVLDPKTLSSEAKKAFRMNYDKLKTEGNLPSKTSSNVNFDFALKDIVGVPQ